MAARRPAVGVVRLVLVGSREPADRRCEQHTQPDAADPVGRRRSPARRGHPSRSLGRGSAVAGSSPCATRSASGVPGTASAGDAHDRAVRRRGGRSRSRARGWPAGRARRAPAARGIEAGPGDRRVRRGDERREAVGSRDARPAVGQPDRDRARRPVEQQADALARRGELGGRAEAVERAALHRDVARRRGQARRGRRRRAAVPARRSAPASRPGPARRARRPPTASAARTSAAKSARVTSTSWPTPHDDRASDGATTARTTRSSLNGHRSSSEPPPRARIVTTGASRSRPASISSARCALEAPERGHDARRRSVALDLARRRARPGPAASGARGRSRCPARPRPSGS